MNLKLHLFATLRRQLVVGMVLVTGVMMTSFAWNLTQRQKSMLLEQQTRQATSMAESIATSSAVWLVARDYSGLQEIVEAQQRYPDLEFVIILDHHGQVLAHSDTQQLGKYLRGLPHDTEFHILRQTSALVDVISPVVLAGQPAGWVRIGIAQRSTAARIDEITRDGFFFVLASLVISMFVASLLARQLTRRLYAIQSVTDAVQNGNTQLRAHVTGRDEAAQLARRFNEMLDKLARRESELIASRDASRLQARAIEESPVMVVITDTECNIEYANPAFTRITGHPVDEILGQNIRFLQSGQTSISTYEKIFACLRKGESWSGELLDSKKDGSLIWLSATLSPVRDDTGEVINFVAVEEDITERKALQAEVLQQRDHLEKLVEIRTSQLEKSRDAAEAASRAKSNFLSNMSHEIRTPMNAIIGMTDLVLDTPLKPQQQKLLRSVAVSAKSLLTILNDILDLSKLESGKMEMESIPFSLREVFIGVEETIRASAAAKGLELALQLDDKTPPCVLGDPYRLRQVLLNLAGNAVKFTQHGSILISARPVGRSDEWHFSIRDTGIGIAKDRQEKVFERFTQADESTTRRFGGTGLGTSISREIVERMGGRIWVESKEGQGSDFQFTAHFPVASGVTECSAHLVGRQLGLAPRTRPLKILLAEDIPLNQELAQLRLSQRGHEVVVVENGLLAIERLKQESFDLILMDVMMPEMDGEAATRAIRAMEKNKGGHIPIIMLTASVMRSDQCKYFEAGADDFAGKPIDFVELYEKIARFFPVIDTVVDKVPTEDLAKLPLVTGIDLRAGLSIWGDMTAYRKALLSFIKDYADTAARLQSQFEAGRFDEATLLAHTVKGLAGNLGAKKLAAAFSLLEICARETETDIKTPLEQARMLMEQAAVAIGEVEHMQAPSQATASADPARALPLLERLIAALERSELDEAAIGELREVLDADHYAHLEELIDSFEFDQAISFSRGVLERLPKQGGEDE